MGAIAAGLYVAVNRDSAGACGDGATALVIDVPLVLLGAGAAIGGAANVLGIALVVGALGMGTLSVWVPR